MRILLIYIGLVLMTISLKAQSPVPGKSSDQKVLIRYATAHIGNGTKIENAYVAVQGDQLLFVKDANSSRINTSEFDEVIDAEGKHIYPGFIVMDSRLGLTEIGAVRATNDYDELGDYNPNVRALPAFNTESKVISTMRPNGVLMAQVAPKGGVISGSSSAMHFDGWNWKDAAVKPDEGIYLNWPSRYSYSGHWTSPRGPKKQKSYGEEVAEIYSYFQESKAYSELDNPKNINVRFMAMGGLFDGTQRLYVRVDWAKDILDVVNFLRDSGVKKYAIVGGTEAHIVTTELKENNIPVVIDRVHKLPAHNDDPIDAPYKLAARLNEAGVQVAFATSGDMEAMIARNLPFQVGTAVYYGLEYEKAIESITLTPAKLMGIDKKYGSLESGKSATFFISSGDALDMRTNIIERAYINGKLLNLENHQTALYKRFLQKIED